MSEQLTRGGIVIGPKTALPQWRGEPFNVGYAIDVLRQDEAFVRRAPYVAAETRRAPARPESADGDTPI